jgi:hypothetical protein
MSSSAAPAKPPVKQEPGTASPLARGVVSYLLFLHFFFLAVGIKSNTSSSGLDQDLRNKVPGLKPYLQLLGMDLSYMFHLTHYNGRTTVRDTDYFIEAEVRRPDGSTENVSFTARDRLPPIRTFRDERLAYNAAEFAESGDDNLISLLPQAIARRIMAEQQCRALTLRIRRRLLQDLMLPKMDPRYNVEHLRTPDDPAYFETLYEARAFLTDDGEVSVSQVKSASDTAAPQGATPVTTPSAPALPAAAGPTATPSAAASGTGASRP